MAPTSVVVLPRGQYEQLWSPLSSLYFPIRQYAHSQSSDMNWLPTLHRFLASGVSQVSDDCVKRWHTMWDRLVTQQASWSQCQIGKACFPWSQRLADHKFSSTWAGFNQIQELGAERSRCAPILPWIQWQDTWKVVLWFCTTHKFTRIKCWDCLASCSVHVVRHYFS